MLLFLVGVSLATSINGSETTTATNTDQTVLSDQAQFWWDAIMMVVTKSSSSHVTLVLLCTLLSLFLCWGLATNSHFQSRAEAFRVGLQRRVIKPITTPFRRLLQRGPPDDLDQTVITSEPSTNEDGDTVTITSNTTNGNTASSTLKNSFADMAMFLKDLAPPFSGNSTAVNESLTDHLDSPDVTHFCFLLHGHRGLSKDLTYMQVQMQRVVAAEKQKRQRSSTSSTTSDGEKEPEESNGNESDFTPPPSPPSSIHGNQPRDDDDPHPAGEHIHDMVVHNSVCNEGKTNDGIRNAGDRLVEEMRQVIEDEMIKRHPELETFLKALRASEIDNEDDQQEEQQLLESSSSSSTAANATTEPSKIYNITISILGNSLGGLYGRYAIAKLVERNCVFEPETDCWVLDGRFRLHLNIFCTTATPHLGVSRHTYVKLPRSAEIGVAHAMGYTGKDLFRLNDLLYTMATSPTFLKPLAKFRKRIAYANAYGTDFPVPASTAAFLSENSTYPHYIIETNTSSTSTHTSDDGTSTTTTSTAVEKDSSHDGLVIATLMTPAQPSEEEGSDGDEDTLEVRSNASHSNKSGDGEDELAEMSRSLDRLGWKKVFVDIRRELPSAELPKSFWTRRQSSDDSLDDTNTAAAAPIPNLQSLQLQNRVVESREVASAVASATDNRVALPLAHNMIVAFSRSRLLAFMNKGGRPIVDALAKELVEDIFTWDQTQCASEVASGHQQKKTSTWQW